jgi:hypothetical protein
MNLHFSLIIIFGIFAVYRMEEKKLMIAAREPLRVMEGEWEKGGF